MRKSNEIIAEKAWWTGKGFPPAWLQNTRTGRHLPVGGARADSLEVMRERSSDSFAYHEPMERPAQLAFSPRLILGLLLLVAGVLVLLDNLGFLRSGVLAGWWPAGVAVIGLLQLIFGDNRFVKTLGVGLILLGGALVFANLNPDVLHSDEVWDYVWPVALVVLGGFLVAHTLFPARHGRRSGNSSNRVRIFTFWSGQIPTTREILAP